MNLYIYAIVGSLLASAGAYGFTPDEEKKAEELHRRSYETKPPRSPVEGFTSSERELLREWLVGRVKSKRERAPSFGMGWNGIILASLDDEEGLGYVAKEFAQRPRRDWAPRFAAIRNPRLIAMIGEFLFREEAWDLHGGDLYLEPSQCTSARAIIETIRFAPQFTPATREWAQDLYHPTVDPKGAVLKILRDWYRENEERLRAGMFEEIEPGQRFIHARKQEPIVSPPVVPKLTTRRDSEDHPPRDVSGQDLGQRGPWRPALVALALTSMIALAGIYLRRRSL